MTDRAMIAQLDGYGLTTAEIHYYRPDHPSLLQLFVWQDYDLPPGFPVLVPGQVVSKEIVYFLAQLDVKEIHGYNHELGLSVITQEALARMEVARAAVTHAAKVSGNGSSEPARAPEAPMLANEHTVQVN